MQVDAILENANLHQIYALGGQLQNELASRRKLFASWKRPFVCARARPSVKGGGGGGAGAVLRVNVKVDQSGRK